MQKFLATSIAVVVTFLFISAVFILQRSFRQPPQTPRVTVTIPEGSTVEDINKILVEKKVLLDELLNDEVEGYLFPDTYEFFLQSSVLVVEEKLTENFQVKITSILPNGLTEGEIKNIIIKASLIEKEVPDSAERLVISGIIDKRNLEGVPLQIDATICYIKEDPCLPITEEDKNIDSLYNTYRYTGLPIGPINNPGLDAIEASITPRESEYWYYISDPKTGQTIFAKSLDEHNSNVVKYLGN